MVKKGQRMVGWLIDWMNGVKRRFQQYFSYIAVVSAPILAFLEFF